LLILTGCGDSNVETVAKNESAQSTTKEMPNPHTMADAATGTATAAGITWVVPAGWKIGPERQMRVATYMVGSGASEADCAVFFFGPGQGGDVQANIDRWIGQFVQADGSPSKDAAKIAEHTINNMKVTTIDLAGNYTASMGGPMSGQKEDRPGYRMLGAIVEAPQGPVFFKLTGPEATVVNALDDFMHLVESAKEG
jgi:hypothetical protein